MAQAKYVFKCPVHVPSIFLNLVVYLLIKFCFYDGMVWCKIDLTELLPWLNLTTIPSDLNFTCFFETRFFKKNNKLCEAYLGRKCPPSLNFWFQDKNYSQLYVVQGGQKFLNGVLIRIFGQRFNVTLPTTL